MEVPAVLSAGQGELAGDPDDSRGTALFLGRFSEHGQPVPLGLVLSNPPPEMPDLGYPPCFCITGHGRSATSLVASMLASGGLNIGSRLLGPNEGNVRGHFEDLDFYEFHVAVLTSQALNEVGYILQPSVQVQQQFLPAARALVETRRATGKPWGWKDPRSVLFLDFWQSLLPELRFILLFRSPWEVVDSLFRRGTDAVFNKNPNFAVKVWQNYNRAILDFHDRFPRKCLLVESHAAVVAPQRLRETIAARFGQHLAPLHELFDPNLFAHESTSQLRATLGHFFPAAVDLYHQLRARATLIHRSWEAAAPSAVDDPNHDWALQHWLDFRVMEKECKRLKAQTARLEGALAEVQEKAESLAAARPGAEHATQLALAQTTLACLEQERTCLEQQRTCLEQQRTCLEQQRTCLEQERTCLEQERTCLEEELTRYKSRVTWMESSRFWKLRRLWLRLKRLAG